MAEINDFGFTAVDQDELKTKTGEDASIGKEVADQLKAVAASNVGQAKYIIKHNYDGFLIDNEDTIWVDEECYNDWCICIDECNPGLCCALLR